ncbi:hypothetical protein BOTBODRAFT_29355 [Botryobasidium botryosum FD-172 SS1]|uniref:Translocation protein sec66 n=1 Tax=Botryobasidium botryosum (strain FD-172 SS1) TaxID=930990 RepID=A0A067MTK2_BOTB1|nr:hypothetical protein BOTBODRAFT_29355 [Botryobasidium botryosum FD-172 SS1]
MTSIFVPLAYLVGVLGALITFSRIYRKRAAAQRYEPWFPSHPERDTYITLLQQSSPAVPETILKAALLRRAVADVHRIFRIRDDKPALANLLQKGSIGDDLWTRFLSAEKEIEAEIMDVVSEANTFREGWGTIIFQTASEMVQNEKTRDIFLQIPKVKAEKEALYGLKPSTSEAPSTPSSAKLALPSAPNGANARGQSPKR